MRSAGDGWVPSDVHGVPQMAGEEWAGGWCEIGEGLQPSFMLPGSKASHVWWAEDLPPGQRGRTQ